MASRREAASAQAAGAAPAGPEGATEGGASSDPARPGDQGLPSGTETSSEPPAAPSAAQAAPARPAEPAVSIGPGTAPGDDTQTTNGGPGAARDLEPADDRRTVGDRGLAPEPGAAAGRDELTGQPDPAPIRDRGLPAPARARRLLPGRLGAGRSRARRAGWIASDRRSRRAILRRRADPVRPPAARRLPVPAQAPRRPGSRPDSAGRGRGREPPPPGRPQDGRDRVSSAAASDAAAWNASELPGQAAVTDTAV